MRCGSADGSRRTITMCAFPTLFSMASAPGAVEFKIVSAKALRLTRRAHRVRGYACFIDQPSYYRDRRLLHDADFLHPYDAPTSHRPGITSDLFLTSKSLFESKPFFDSHPSIRELQQQFMRKWEAISARKPSASMLYGHSEFDERFCHSLQLDLSKAPVHTPHVAVSPGSLDHYTSFTFLPAAPDPSASSKLPATPKTLQF